MVHYLLHKDGRLIAGGKMATQIRCTLENCPITFLFPIDSWKIQTATDLTIKQEHF